MNKILVYTLFLLLSFNAYSQSPWIGKKGSFYGQLSTTYLGYSSIINDKLNEIVETDFKTRDITTNIYADYSLKDNLAVLVSLPYKLVQHNNQSLSSLGDPSFKLKYQFSESLPFSGYVGYTAPLSKREGVLRTGYSQHMTELGLSIGVGKEKFFTYAGLGYRYRDNIPNQVLVEFEYGSRFLVAQRTFYLTFRVDGVFNTSTTIDPEAGEANLFHNDAEFLSPALKFSYNAFDKVWINLGLHSAVLVRYFGAASTVTAGIAYKIDK